MKSAIIILDKENDLQMAFKPLLDRTVIEWATTTLNDAEVNEVRVVIKDCDKKIKGAMVTSTLYEAIKSLDSSNTDTVVIDGLYPFIEKNTYCKMFDANNTRLKGTHIIKLNIKDIINIKDISFEEVDVGKKELKTLNTYLELYETAKELRHEINLRHLMNGVNIIDLDHTYIGKDVIIEDNATIYPDVNLEGKTVIGKNTLISSGCYIVDSKIGNDTKILSSRVTDSVIKNEVTLGPNSHLRMNTVIEDKVRIGNFVEFKNTTFGYKSRSAHLTYLGDSTVGDDVNIGCGVITVNYDGAHKFHTEIGDHAFIGSNASLIAPIKVGHDAVVAAGSTVYEDVEDTDMAIARAYQVNKQGRGYSYINKEK